MLIRIESLEPPANENMCELINYVCQPWIEHPVFGQYTASQSVSAIVGRNRFGTVLFSLPLLSDCTVFVLFLSVSSSGECLLTLLKNIIVETLNYANIISRID